MSPLDLLLISTLLAASCALVLLARGLRLSPEPARKFLHAALGLLLTPLPWLFASPAPVALLCAAYLALLIARRFVAALDRQVATVIYAVDRRSAGEFYYPVAVFSLFCLTPNDPAAFAGPLLTLALADAAAALVGRRLGLCHYPTPAGRKTLEGSLAFAAVAAACCFAALTLWPAPGAHPDTHTRRLLIAAITATAAMLAEAIAARGLDNVLIPLVSLAGLRALAPLSTGALLLTAGAAALAVLILITAWALVVGPYLPEPLSTTVSRSTRTSRPPTFTRASPNP